MATRTHMNPYGLTSAYGRKPDPYAGREIIIPGGRGYWDLERYPWGGDFRRLPSGSPVTGTIERVIELYKSGVPKRIVVSLPGGVRGGFEFDSLSMKIPSVPDWSPGKHPNPTGGTDVPKRKFGGKTYHGSLITITMKDAQRWAAKYRKDMGLDARVTPYGKNEYMVWYRRKDWESNPAAGNQKLAELLARQHKAQAAYAAAVSASGDETYNRALASQVPALRQAFIAARNEYNSALKNSGRSNPRQIHPTIMGICPNCSVKFPVTDRSRIMCPACGKRLKMPKSAGNPVLRRNSTDIELTDVAKIARRILKQRFPHTKFSVRSSRYAGGSSIDVSWIDGPTTKAVEAAVGHLEGSEFDGTIDLKSRTGAPYQNDFIMFNRSYSDASMEKMADQLRAKYGIPQSVGLYDRLDRAVWEKLGHAYLGQAAAHELASLALS